MDRREALRRTATLMGGAVFMPTIAGVLNGCTAQSGVQWEPDFFSDEEAELVTRLSDVIIPPTDTPGAAEAGVPAFIEEMVATAYEEEDRDRFMSGLAEFNREARSEYDRNYVDLAESDQIAFAEERNREAIEGEQEDTPFFLVMKELTLVGYFTSEVGATETLRHVKIPGRYDGCAPLEDIGKTWAV